MTRNTPWGYADHIKKIAEGITEYGTPSHGGIGLSATRILEMRDCYRNFAPWAGKGWYEEDCDWAIAVLAFPKEFGPALVDAAKKMATANAAYYRKRGAIIN